MRAKNEYSLSAFLKRALVCLVWILILGLLLEITSFGLLNLGYFIATGNYRSWIGINTAERLHRAGLPRKYNPRGTPPENATPMEVLMSCSPAYKGHVWANEFWEEEFALRRSWEMKTRSRFQPNVIWRNKLRKGKYNNVNQIGIRHTVNEIPKTSSQVMKVFMFGGSTTLGLGNPDEFTIPSLLSKELNTAGETSYEVTNFGTEAFILEQDMELFFDEIRQGNLPEIAIFYHGFNDVYAAAFSPGKPGWYMASQLLEMKFYQEFPIGLKGLHTYQLIARLKAKNAFNNEKHFLQDYSTRASQFLRGYKTNLRLINLLGKELGIKVYFFWHPILLYGNKKLDKFEKALINHPALLSSVFLDEKEGIHLLKAFETTYRLIEEETSFEDFENFHNLSRLFDDIDGPLFTDLVHMGPKANEIVSKKIMSSIILKK